MNVTFRNGDTLSITTLESARPFGNASFQARVLPPPAMTGTLRKLGEKDLYLEGADNKVARFRLLSKTEFRDEQGVAIRDSLLRRGDRLAVFVNPDDSETALAVVLVRAKNSQQSYDSPRRNR
jgi:hypothetical protein